jgi:hypothetical protein
MSWIFQVQDQNIEWGREVEEVERGRSKGRGGRKLVV